MYCDHAPRKTRSRVSCVPCARARACEYAALTITYRGLSPRWIVCSVGVSLSVCLETGHRRTWVDRWVVAAGARRGRLRASYRCVWIRESSVSLEIQIGQGALCQGGGTAGGVRLRAVWVLGAAPTALGRLLRLRCCGVARGNARACCRCWPGTCTVAAPAVYYKTLRRATIKPIAHSTAFFYSARVHTTLLKPKLRYVRF